MEITMMTVQSYNGRRYSQPWAAEIVDGKNKWLDRSVYHYAGADAADGGKIVISDPVDGRIYSCGQKDNRGGNTVTVYLLWTGSRFVPCNRQGDLLDADAYAAMLRHNGQVAVNWDEQVGPASGFAETA